MGFVGQSFFCLLSSHSFTPVSLVSAPSSFRSTVQFYPFFHLPLSFQVSLPDLTHVSIRISSPPPSLLPLALISLPYLLAQPIPKLPVF